MNNIAAHIDALLNDYPYLFNRIKYGSDQSDYNYFSFKDNIIRSDISKSIDTMLYYRSIQAHANTKSIILSSAYDSNYFMSVNFNGMETLEISSIVLTLPDDILSKESCVLLYEMNIDIRYNTTGGKWMYYNKKEIMREKIINDIIEYDK